jgi:hypothetical protein
VDVLGLGILPGLFLLIVEIAYNFKNIYSHSIFPQSYLRIPEKSRVAFPYTLPANAILRAWSAFQNAY